VTLQQLILLVLQASILMTVFSFGLRARLANIVYLVEQPRLLLRSLIAMFVIMPAIATVLVKVFELRPSVEIALVALSISPLPPLLPGKVRKDQPEAFALALMVFVGLLSIVIVPVAALALQQFATRQLTMPTSAVASLVLKTTVLPLAVGLLFHRFLPAITARIVKPVDVLAKLLLLVGVVALLGAAFPAMMSLIGNGTLAAIVVFITLGLAVGHMLGGPQEDQKYVLAFASASRHPVIALMIAKANFPDEPLLGPTILLYLVVNMLVGVAYHVWEKRRAAA